MRPDNSASTCPHPCDLGPGANRPQKSERRAASPLVALAADPDPEIRAQVGQGAGRRPLTPIRSTNCCRCSRTAACECAIWRRLRSASSAGRKRFRRFSKCCARTTIRDAVLRHSARGGAGRSWRYRAHCWRRPTTVRSAARHGRVAGAAAVGESRRRKVSARSRSAAGARSRAGDSRSAARLGDAGIGAAD